MKYLYIGLGLLAVCLSVSLVCMWQLCSDSEEISAVLEQAVSACDDGDYRLAYDRAMEAEQLWEDHEGFLCALLDHTETDAIHWNFSDIRSYMSSETEQEFRASCAEALAMVRHLKEMELPYFYNLL